MAALKIVIGLWLIVISIFITASSAQAQAQDLNSTNFNYFIHGQTTIEGAIGHTFFCSILRASPFNGGNCAGYKAGGSGKAVVGRFTDGGALGTLGNTTAVLFDNRPTSSTYYLADLGQKVGLLPKPVYAQVEGSGRNIIQPVFRIWEAARNITYLAFTLVFVVIGIMIMLKQKINPQTVVSAQQALPGLVVGLILVTFSYFIAAFLVDLAFIATQLVAQILSPSVINMQNSMGNDLKGLAENSNVLQLFFTTTFNGHNLTAAFSGARDQVVGFLGGDTLGGGLPRIITTVLGAIGGFFILGLPGAAIGGGAGAVGPDFLIPTAVIIVLMLALMVQAFRLLLALLGAYIQILVYALAGPLFILVGSIPGRGSVISGWAKGILANALIFPVVFGGFVFAGIILGSDTNIRSTMPMMGGIDAYFIKVLIAYGILLGLPALPGMVTKAFGVQGQPAFGQAAMGGAMAGFGLGRFAGGRGWGALVGPANREREALQKARAEWRTGVGSVNPDEMERVTARAEGAGWVRRFRNAWRDR